MSNRESLPVKHSRINPLLFALLLLFALPIFLFAKAKGGEEETAIVGEPPTVAILPTSDRLQVNAISTTGSDVIVDIQNREESFNLYQTQYVPSENVASGWTGHHATCEAGSTTVEFQQAILRRVNYFRAMAGVPYNVIFSEVVNAKAQQAALMMSYNNSLSHAPPSTWGCYTAEGAEAAGSSDLALGVYGPSAISMYIKDHGGNNTAVGHRRWILYPQTQIMGTGDVPSAPGYSTANALWVFDDKFGTARPMCAMALSPGRLKDMFPIAWSLGVGPFSYPQADFSDATISMSSGGITIPVTIEPGTNGYGENTLVWIPQGFTHSSNWPRPGRDTTYSIQVNNVGIGGATKDFDYEVTIFDPSGNVAATPTASPTQTPTTAPTATSTHVSSTPTPISTPIPTATDTPNPPTSTAFPTLVPTNTPESPLPTPTATGVAVKSSSLTLSLITNPPTSNSHEFDGGILGVIKLKDSSGQDAQTMKVASGVYTIRNTKASKYAIADITCQPQSAAQIDLAGAGVILTITNEPAVACEFRSTREVRIKTTLFEDRDADGRKDASDPYLSDWEVKVTNLTTNFTLGQLTDSKGWSEFKRLPTDSYRVCPVVSIGWRLTKTDTECVTVSLSAGKTASIKLGYTRVAIQEPGQINTGPINTGQISTGSTEGRAKNVIGLLDAESVQIVDSDEEIEAAAPDAGQEGDDLSNRLYLPWVVLD